MNKWHLEIAMLDCEWQWGFCIGKYTAEGQPIKRHAIRFDKHASNSKVAAELRALADYIEQKMGPLSES